MMYTSEQHTYSSREHFHLEEGEKVLTRGNENFRALGEIELATFRKLDLTTEPPGPSCSKLG